MTVFWDGKVACYRYDRVRNHGGQEKSYSEQPAAPTKSGPKPLSVVFKEQKSPTFKSHCRILLPRRVKRRRHLLQNPFGVSVEVEY